MDLRISYRKVREHFHRCVCFSTEGKDTECSLIPLTPLTHQHCGEGLMVLTWHVGKGLQVPAQGHAGQAPEDHSPVPSICTPPCP